MVENEIIMEKGEHTLYLIYKRNIFFSFFFLSLFKEKRKIGGIGGVGGNRLCIMEGELKIL